MRAYAGWMIAIVAACGGAPARPASPPPPAPEGSPTASPPPSPPALTELLPPPATDAQLAMLRDLVAATDGEERLAVQHRLYTALLARGPADRPEAAAILADMRASPALAGWARGDEVLFDHGTLLAAERRRAEARAAWQRLIDEHPRSRLAADAHLALAEAAFDDGDLAAAEVEYRQVLALAGARRAAYARYKLGWVHYNRQELDEALAAFAEVARTAGEPLRREALKDVVRAYAGVGDPAAAPDYFDRLDRGRGARWTALLAEVYLDEARHDEAARAYAAAIPRLDLDGACAAAPRVAELVRLAARSGGASAAVAAAQAALAEWRLVDCPPR